MTEHVASRTLVKSPPELWAECSDATSLARHLDQFGEIRITRLEPETAVAWEGERARGTVRFEPSGWGTKVILTAVAVREAIEPLEEREPPAAPEPVEETEVVEQPEVVEEPEAVEEPEPPEAADPDPVAVAEPLAPIEPSTDTPAPRRRFARLFGLFRAPRPESGALEEPIAVEESAPELAPTPEPELQAEPEPAPEPTPGPEPASEPVTANPPGTETPATEAALTAALDSLGQAHHRPYSRA